MAKPDESELRIAEIVGPKPIADGIYLTGHDIAGDTSTPPGGINFMDDLTGYTWPVIRGRVAKMRGGAQRRLESVSWLRGNPAAARSIDPTKRQRIPALANARRR